MADTEYDPHCPICGIRVYGLWCDSVPPPFGCSEGLDAVPWACSKVLTAILFGVIAVDHMGKSFLPHHERIFKLIGTEKTAEIIAYIRKHNRAPEPGKSVEPSYHAPSLN